PAATAAPAATPAQMPTATPEPTPAPQTEFVITCLGDCTMWSSQNYQYHPAGYAGVMDGDYAYPFSNTVQFFKDDEFTITNCECTLTDNANLTYDYTQVYFPFRAPTEYAEIFNEGGVDFVTTANNHMMDCYQAGADSTYAALEAHGVPFGKEGEGQIIETEHGLKLGIYCSGTDLAPNRDKAVKAVGQLKADGAEYIICAFHWGQELYYSPNKAQIELAHACIDAGADLIYGSHTHCLQPIEEYGDGLILYSCGNWTFGGSTMPKDPDTAIFQVKLERAEDGSLRRVGIEVIPCCVSSNLAGAAKNEQNYNNYCPTPYETDSEEFNRVYAKLTGEYQPSSQGADYSDWLAQQGG
ncbi:MAG: CapA family protein, partial [Oscillospiraceae bacterium]|nr:CapA family protein [Oscillospiraceae bacterium]